MKIMRKELFMAAACSVMALVAWSCGKENINPGTPETQPSDPPQEDVKMVDVTLSAGVEDTKVFSDGNTLKWNGTADKLAVFAEVSGDMVRYQFDKAAGSSAISAEFTGSVAETAVLKYASYAYSEDRTCVSDVLGLNLSDQSCDATNSVPHNTPLYGIISGTSVTMQSPCAFLKVMLPKTTGDATLSIYDKVTVSAANAFGNFTVDCSGETPVVSSGDKSTINISPRKSSSGYVYVPILPGTYDDITITIDYNDAHADFSRNSTETQTFVSGYAYDCHEVAGPYVESVTTGAGSVEETTLSMAGSAVLWKYAGVTNSDYTCKFFYAPTGTAKDAAGWTEVSASSVTGDGTAVSFSASATVAAGVYDFYAQVSDGDVTIDGEIVGGSAKVDVAFTFAELTNGTADGQWAYTGYSSGGDIGSIKITNADGNDIFPNGKMYDRSINYKIWNGSGFGEVQTGSTQTASPTLPGNLLGVTWTKTVGGQDYVIDFLKQSSQDAYYAVWSNQFISTYDFAIRINCPSGCKITKITVSSPSGTNKCVFGIGESVDDFNILSKKDRSNASEAVVVECNIASPVTGKSYYFRNGKANQTGGSANLARFTSITVTYVE